MNQVQFIQSMLWILHFSYAFILSLSVSSSSGSTHNATLTFLLRDDDTLEQFLVHNENREKNLNGVVHTFNDSRISYNQKLTEKFSVSERFFPDFSSIWSSDIVKRSLRKLLSYFVNILIFFQYFSELHRS